MKLETNNRREDGKIQKYVKIKQHTNSNESKKKQEKLENIFTQMK